MILPTRNPLDSRFCTIIGKEEDLPLRLTFLGHGLKELSSDVGLDNRGLGACCTPLSSTDTLITDIESEFKNLRKHVVDCVTLARNYTFSEAQAVELFDHLVKFQTFLELKKSRNLRHQIPARDN